MSALAVGISEHAWVESYIPDAHLEVEDPTAAVSFSQRPCCLLFLCINGFSLMVPSSQLIFRKHFCLFQSPFCRQVSDQIQGHILGTWFMSLKQLLFLTNCCGFPGYCCHIAFPEHFPGPPIHIQRYTNMRPCDVYTGTHSSTPLW